MGLYDILILDVNILPDLTQEERLLLTQNECQWQTKSFENVLTEVYITKKEDTNIRHKFIEDKFPFKLQIRKSEWITSIVGSLKETKVKLLDLDYTGEFTFYTNIKKELGVGANQIAWFDFIAEVRNGKIISIKRIFD